MKTLLLSLTLIATLTLASTSPPARLSPCTGAPHPFVVTVTSPEGGAVSFDGAIAFDGDLKVFDSAVTPQRLEIVATRIIATFKSKTGEALKASLYAREDGQDAQVGSTTSTSPAMYESVSCDEPLIRAFGSF